MMGWKGNLSFGSYGDSLNGRYGDAQPGSRRGTGLWSGDGAQNHREGVNQDFTGTLPLQGSCAMISNHVPT
jgi:hypothetical protein